MTRPSRILLALLVSAGLPTTARCAKHQRSRPPVILISIDTLRADHLAAYGYRGVATPGLDALRKDSILFENAYAAVPLTLPSHASLLTGLLPYENGVRDNIGFRLGRDHPTMAVLLKANGYVTGAAVSSFALRRDRGLDAGFDFYDDEFSPTSPDERPGVETAARLERWIDAAAGGASSPERPVFAFFHLYEPHTPYAPPEPYRTRYAANPYDGEIAAADAAVAGFLRFLKLRRLYDPALIVFLSDHGEGLNDHGEEEHGVFLYRETIRVPLFVKLPHSARAGETVRDPVGLVDVFPTVAAVTGAPSPRSSGVSLASAPSQLGRSRRLYSETLYPRLQLGWSDLASLTDARYQYIEAPRPELYDLVRDPGERSDLASGRPPEFRAMRLALERLQRPFVSPEKSSPEELAKLGSLGYLSVNAGASARNLPDPKDKIATLAKYKELFSLFYAKRDAEAVALAREILSEDPAILSVSRMMSVSLDRLGRPGEAARVLRAALERPNPGGTSEDLAQAYGQLATALEKARDPSGAEKALREAISRNVADETIRRRLAQRLLETGRAADSLALLPSAGGAQPDTEDRLLQAAALAQTGRTADARGVLLSLIEKEPGNATALYQLGMLSLQEGDAASARRWLERALAANPRSAGTLTALGLAQAGAGDSSAALDSWTRALAIDPQQYEALFNRSILVGRLGKADEARRGLTKFLATAPKDRFPREREEAQRLLKSLGPVR